MYSNIIQNIEDLFGSNILFHYNPLGSDQVSIDAKPQESQKDSCTEHRLGHCGIYFF
jgi:hypothetical protein